MQHEHPAEYPYTVIWASDRGKSWKTGLSDRGLDELLDNLGAYGVKELHVFGPEGEIEEYAIRPGEPDSYDYLK